jgi:hypothetical protein
LIELSPAAQACWRCAEHNAVIEGVSPLWDLLEVTMSEKQLHELALAIEVAGLVLL